ncbi:MAG: hypothetical protein AAB874_04735 [Patescibacteria group bacterium]
MPEKFSSQAQATGFAGFRGMSRNLLLLLVFVLMSLPLFTTFNEILTKFAEKSGVYSFLAKNVVPFETRAVSLILKPFGIEAKPTISHLFIRRPDGTRTGIFLSWNCLGWQSAVLLILTLITGLSGSHSWDRKLETILLGVSGIFLVNLVRITPSYLRLIALASLPPQWSMITEGRYLPCSGSSSFGGSVTHIYLKPKRKT